MCINFNSILSSFDKKGTLLKWLKEVEKKLPHSVLTSAAVEQVDATHIKIVFTYEDGTVVESESIALTSADAAYLNTVLKAGTDITITLNGEVLTVALNSSVRTAIQAAANTANTAKTMASAAQTAANNAQATADGKSTVIANPTLAGTEATLTGLSVNGTKYKVPAGGSGGGTEVVGNPDVTGQSPARLKDIKIDNEYFEITNGYFNLGNFSISGSISSDDISMLANDRDLLLRRGISEVDCQFYRYAGSYEHEDDPVDVYCAVNLGDEFIGTPGAYDVVYQAILIHTVANTWNLYEFQLQPSLPKASSTTLGGVKVGSGLSVASDGTLSATGGSGGGTQLYMHNIMLNKADGGNATINVYSTSSAGVTSNGQLSSLIRGAIGVRQGNFAVVAYYATNSSIIIIYINQNSEIVRNEYTKIMSDYVTAI